MTTTITRLYKSTRGANTVVSAMRESGLNPDEIDLIGKEEAEDGSPISERLAAAGVWPDAIAAYAEAIEAGNILVVARAPFGEAKGAIEAAGKAPTVDVGIAEPDRLVQDMWSTEGSILKDHPLFLTERPGSPYARRYGPISSMIGMQLLSEPKPRDSAVGKSALMSTKFLPVPLLMPHKPRTSAAAFSGLVSKRFLPFPILTKRKEPGSAVGKAGTPFSTALALPLLVSRQR